MKRTAFVSVLILVLSWGLAMYAPGPARPASAGAGAAAAGAEVWVQQDSHVTNDLQGVCAANSETAWAVGRQGTIVATRDEGVNWTRQGSLTGNDLIGADCTDSIHAWAVGNGGTVRYTTSGGGSWSIGECNMGNDLTGVTMQNDTTGWASGLPSPWHPFSSMWNTTNGKDFNDQGWWFARSLRGVSAWDAAHGVAVGDGSITCTTTDGTNWGDVLKVGSKDWSAVRAVPGTKKAIAVGSVGTVAVCDNYGTKASDWVMKNSGTGSDLMDVAVVDENTAWAVGGDGIILKTVDGGNSWITQASPVARALFGIAAADKNHAWAVGERGTILYASPQPVITGCDPGRVQQGFTGVINVTGSNTHFEDGKSRAFFYPGEGINVVSTSIAGGTNANVHIQVDKNATLEPSSVNIVTDGETPVPLVDGLVVVSTPTDPPHVNGISPSLGPAGGFVTLNGSAFGDTQGLSSVVFRDRRLATEYRSWSNSGITCRVPLDATTGDVFVQTPWGSSNAVPFTVAQPQAPMILDCNPKDVVQGHSIEVDIKSAATGYINGVSKATFSGDGIKVTITRVSDPTHATAFIEVSKDATPGFRDVNVITQSETPQPLANVFRVFKAPAVPPDLRDITPAAGMISTGVALTGKNFGAVRGSSEVIFNGKPANHFISWSDSRIECSVPFGATSGMVQVKTPWGTSGGLHFEVKDFTFYFAEGTCRPNFDSYLTIQNPDDEQASVKVTYMLGDGGTKGQDITVGAHSRSTIAVSGILGVGDDAAHDFSAQVDCTNDQEIIVERPMYFNFQGYNRFNWTGGHDVVGAIDPARTFYFAEGTCRPNFEPYICIQNPGNTDANVKITYMLGNGQTREQAITVFKKYRLTMPVKGVLGEKDDAAHDFSARLECTNGQEIVAERPMYFNYRGSTSLNWNGGHDVVGLAEPGRTFYFAEGSCRPNFDSYICVQNPGQAHADVKVTYMTGLGGEVEQVISVAPNSRYTIAVRNVLGVGDDAAHDFSARVESLNGQEIVAERPSYFNYNGVWNDGHDVVGALAPASTFYFAEGTCRPNFRPYITILNPELTHVGVKITYMLGNGQTREQALSIPAGSRATVPVSDFLGVADDAAHDFSAKVECTSGRTIVAERPMYFNYNGVWNGGSDAVGFHAD